MIDKVSVAIEKFKHELEGSGFHLRDFSTVPYGNVLAVPKPAEDHYGYISTFIMELVPDPPSTQKGS